MISCKPLALSLFALYCTSASAAQIKVEEFGTITRITVPLQPNVEMRVRHPRQGIKVEAATTYLDLSAPQLPSNSRLGKLDVWKSDFNSGIDVSYACECTSSSYMANNNALVIDIAERPVPVRAVPATIVTRQRSVAKMAPVEVRENVRSNAEALRLSMVLVATPPPRTKPAREAPEGNFDEAVQGIRNAVRTQLNDAAAEGRISLSEELTDTRRAMEAGCPDEAALDLRRLTDTTDFRTALPTLRAVVLDEMKQVNRSAVRDLARHFIAFGLGTEVKAIFRSFETSGPAENLINDMAMFLDGEYDQLEQSALFHKDCGRHAAVWRTGLNAVKQTGGVIDAYAATEGAVFDLPDPLRMSLGAQIALGLIDEGNDEAAMRIWRSLETAIGPETPEIRLLKAYVLPLNRTKDAALPRLVKLAESRTPDAVQAALRAADILITGSNRGIAVRTIEALDDLIYIHETADHGPALVLARAKLNARYGDVASAIDALNARLAAEPKRADYWNGIIQKTIRSAVEGADPEIRSAEFAEILKLQKQLDQSPESDAARLALARQMVDTGAAHLVDQVLTPALLTRSPDARHVAAKAALLMGNSRQAIALLKGARDADSIELRRRAMTLGADDVRTLSVGRFDAMPKATADAPLGYARELLEQSQTDLTIVEEMLSDG